MIKKICLSVLLLLLAVHLLTVRSESYIRARVVKLSSNKGMCSGEQIRAPSGVDYILTAAHCRNLADSDTIDVTDADGNMIKRKIIAEDPLSDLLLIEGLPGLKGLEIAPSDYQQEHVRTFTHGRNMNTYRTEGELVQHSDVQALISVLETPAAEAACAALPKNKVAEVQTFMGPLKVCVLSVLETVSTAHIVPGSSGGPIVDDSGKLIGVASCSDNSSTFSYLVLLSDIQRFVKGY